MTQPTEIIVVESTEQAVQLYEFTPEDVRNQLAQYRDLQFGTPKEYEAGRKAIATCRDLRLSFDEKRKQLNEKALEHTRMVNATGKALIEAVAEVEKPLKERKDAADAEKARQKAAREAEELRVQLAREQAAREAEEARIRAEAAAALETKVRAALEMPMEHWIECVDAGRPEYVVREAETEGCAVLTLSIGATERAHPMVVAREAECRAILRERKAAEQARLAAERVELERQRQELAAEKARQAAALDEQERVAREAREAEELQLQAEREALEVERRRIDEQKRLAELAEAERLAKIRAEREAAEQDEANRIAAEEAAVAEAERQVELARRREALRPDKERVQAWVAALLAVPAPEVTDAEAQGFVRTLRESLDEWQTEAERIGDHDG